MRVPFTSGSNRRDLDPEFLRQIVGNTISSPDLTVVAT